MSRIINAQYVKRSDLPLIPPTEIEVILSENTRMFEVDVSDLVDSFKVRGQFVPVLVRPVDNNRVRLAAGYRRWMAAMQIWEEQKADGIPEQDRFRLKCVVQEMSPDEALNYNIAENAERSNLSPIECAYAIRRLRNLRGWTDKEDTVKIATMFRKCETWVLDTEKFVSLELEIQKHMHLYFTTHGEQGLKPAVGRVLITIPEENRPAALEAARQAASPAPILTLLTSTADAPAPLTTIGIGRANARIRAAHINDIAKDFGGKPVQGRAVTDLYEFVDGYFDAGARLRPPLHSITRELLTRIKGFFKRDIDAAQLDNTIMRIDGCLAQYYEQYQENRKGPIITKQ